MKNNIVVHIKCTIKLFKTLEGGAQMQITNVRLKKVNSGNKMKAVASVTFDNEFVVHDIKVIEKDGLFIAMPSKKTQNGEFRDVAHPINAETREKIQSAILEKYNETPDVEEEVKNEESEETAESAE